MLEKMRLVCTFKASVGNLACGTRTCVFHTHWTGSSVGFIISVLTGIRLSSDFNSNLFIFRLFCSVVGAHVMSLHLCSAFLVLLTTQNTFNYNSHFNHTLIHHFIPSTSSTLFCLTSTTSFESPVNLTWMSLNRGRRQGDGPKGNWRKPLEAQREHAHSTQKRPQLVFKPGTVRQRR